MAKILLGMSGGVDSTVAARLLLRDGHDVTGITFIMHDSQHTLADDARRAADELGFVAGLRVFLGLARAVKPRVRKKRRADVVAHREIERNPIRVGDDRGYPDTMVQGCETGPQILAIRGIRPSSDLEVVPCIFRRIRPDSQFGAASGDKRAVGGVELCLDRIAARQKCIR